MKSSPRLSSLFVSALLVCFFATWGVAQERRANPFSKPATNLKVLKVEKPEDLRPIMRTFDAALGVECAFCHDTQDFAKDTKAHKETARKMIEMVQKINTQIFTWEGAPKATCNMCHNGSPYPKFNPPAQAAAQAPPAQPGAGQPPAGARPQ